MHELFDKLPPWLREFNYKAYLSDNYVVLDFETTNIDYGNPYNKENSLVCATWRYGPAHPDYTPETQYKRASEYEQYELVKAVERAGFFVAHNTKFEYGWLERCGLDIANSLAFCTNIGEYILRSNRRGSLKLDACLRRRGMTPKVHLGSKLLEAGVCPSTWPEIWLQPYAKQDSVGGEELFLSQRRVMTAQGKLGVAFTRNILTPVLVDMEKRGMHLDADRVYKVYHDYAARMADTQLEFSKLIGGANPNSPKQMREVLYDDFKFQKPTDNKWLGKNKEPTTSFEYIRTLKPRTKKQEKFIEIQERYAVLHAALSKSLTKFMECVRETDDHILTAVFNQTITATQRLSSTGKNYSAQFQNFARIFKPLFSPRNEGWYIGETDQAQLEYRGAVFLGQDEAGMYDIEHKVDAHAYTASIIFEKEWNAVKDDPKSSIRKAIRTASKEHTFKPLYGGKSGKPNEVKYYKAFMQKHKGVSAVQNKWIQEALATKKLKTITGLEFYYPGTKVTESGYVVNTTKICNYQVQMLSTADIVPVSVVYQWHMMRVAGLQSFLISTIHDSSIAEVHPDERKIFAEIAELSFTKVVYKYLYEVYGIDFNVPLEAEIEFKSNWADSEDWQKEFLGEC